MKSIIWCIGFLIKLLSITPQLIKANNYAKKGNLKERDRIMYRLSKEWGKKTFESTGSTIEIIGSENIPEDQPVVFVGNHQSNLDIPILTGYIKKHTCFIAKKELGKIPILSLAIKNMNSILIDRGNARQSLRAITNGANNVKQGYSYVIFPEGTRSKDGTIASFKPGALKLATRSKAPIVPFTIVGANRIMQKGTLKIDKVDVKLIIDKPIYITDENVKDTKGLTVQAEAIVKKNYEAYN